MKAIDILPSHNNNSNTKVVHANLKCTWGWNIFFLRGGGLKIFLEHEMFFSPLVCAWGFFGRQGPCKNCFNTALDWFFFTWLSSHYIFWQFLLSRNFLSKMLQPHPLPLQKNNGLPLSRDCTVYIYIGLMQQLSTFPIRNQGPISNSFSYQIKQTRCIMKNDYTTSFRTQSKFHNGKKIWRKSITFFVDIF